MTHDNREVKQGVVNVGDDKLDLGDDFGKDLGDLLDLVVGSITSATA